MRTSVARALGACALLLSLCIALLFFVAATPASAQEAPTTSESILPDGAETINIWIPLVAAPGRGLNVTPTLDGSRAVSKVITPAGGVLTATSADGDTFTLTFPEGALNITTTIHMTPVQSISGSPFGAPAAGVQIAPDLLGLWKTATLRVVSNPQVPVADQVSFAWFAGGKDFHRFPLTPDPAVVEFGINRLHGFGIGSETVAAAEHSVMAIAQDDWSPADPFANISHQLQQILQQIRENADAGRPEDPAWEAQIETLMRQAWTEVVQPTLQPMTMDCEYAHATMTNALSWARDLQLIGIDSEFAAEIAQINDAIIKAVENCLAEAAEPCYLEEDVAQTIEILGYLRTLLLLGSDIEFTFDDLPQCQRISVKLDGARGKYFPMATDPETGWNTKAYYQIDDDNIAGVLQVIPFNFGGSLVSGWQAAANVTVQGKFGDEWRTITPFLEVWHCRDKSDERIDALIIETSDVEFNEGITAPKAPVQVLASGVGCWRWEVEHTYSSKQRADLPQHDISYTLNTTLEFTGRTPSAYWDNLGQMVKIGGDFMQFGLIGEGSLKYKEVQSSIVCTRTLDVTKEPPEHFGGDYSYTWNFNMDPNAPRDTGNDIGFVINESFKGDCPPATKTYQFISPADDLADNGRTAQGIDSGSLGEGSGTYTVSWNYRALRQ